jgi:predicted Ser/Thr protein kinase
MPAKDRIPDRLGPYRLLERIGEGGMGVVCLARDHERRLVAIKVLHSRVAEELTARRRLAREVEAMRRVRSPFVAEVIDADVTGRFPYIVTRYVPGQTLEQLVREQGPLPPRGLERLARGLAEALVAVHAAGVVHRDLKPGNVMMADGDPVVIDFGIAHTGDATRLTQTGMFMGTPGYLAPEVIEGRPSSEASDIHSWGATVAFAATGRPPFGGGSFETVFFRIMQGRADIDGIPGPLYGLVSAALSHDPRNRPPAAWLHAQSALLDLAAAEPVMNGAAAGAAGAAYGAAYAPGGAAYGARAAGLEPGGLHPGGIGPGALERGSTRRLAEPIRPDEFADLLPPVRYAPAPGAALSGAAQAGPAAAPYGAAAAYPAAGRDTGVIPPGDAGAAASQRRADGSQRARPNRLLGLAVMVIAVSMSVLLPIAGMLSSLAAITLLRAADRAQSALTVRRSVRGASATDVLVGVVTAPWAVARSLLTLVLLAPVALAVAAAVAIVTLVMVRPNPAPLAGAYAAGAVVAFYGIGPGSGGPRRQVNRMAGAVARTRASSAVAAFVIFSLAAAAVVAATTEPPLYWPMISGLLPHLPHLSNLLHLPSVNLPHVNIGKPFG